MTNKIQPTDVFIFSIMGLITCVGIYKGIESCVGYFNRNNQNEEEQQVDNGNGNGNGNGNFANVANQNQNQNQNHYNAEEPFELNDDLPLLPKTRGGKSKKRRKTKKHRNSKKQRK
jgi:hypothetical protein